MGTSPSFAKTPVQEFTADNLGGSVGKRTGDVMRKQNLGVTLMELMIVMAIVGILAAVAYPSYRNQVMKSNRSEAKIVLNQLAQEFEKCFSRFNTYVYVDVATHGQCFTMLNQLQGGGINSTNAKYLVTIPAAGDVSATQFKLTATPQGPQAKDTDCGTWTLNESNTKTVTGGLGPFTCWK
jgi:type IV pilus assembly protein PilE